MPEPAELPLRSIAPPHGDDNPLDPAPGRVSATLANLASETGLRFRLVLADGDHVRVLHDSLGVPDEQAADAEVWALEDGAELRATFGAAIGPDDRSLRGFLAAFTPALVRTERELRFYGREHAGRDWEVELLTGAAETLGAGLALEKGVERLLRHVTEVLDAALAEMWSVDEDETRLVRYASSAGNATRALIDLRLSRGVFAEACRRVETRVRTDDSGVDLLVPVKRSVAHGQTGARGLLRIRRPSGGGFSASDRKLVAAIAEQIGVAFENRRLSDESLERERMLVELELAHHLQLKLLPEVADFADCADIAARCEPAESVGGDFYHLFRLGGGRVGVMLGDISSHGYSAGLIMALTMSAASLVVRDRDHPAAVLRGIHQELVRKLESTDMYMTVCYVVLDPERKSLRYANAGHPHAFRIGPASADRLEALNPPLGLAEVGQYAERDLPWTPGADTLLMFTDGLGETMRADRIWSDDLIVDAVRRNADAPACTLLDGLFSIAASAGTLPADDRTALVLK